MITERGQVLEVGSGHAWVACRRQVDCQRCREGRGCGGGVLGRLLGDRLHRVRVITGGHAVAPGEQVLIGLREDAVLRAALAVYLVPLVAALAGGIVGSVLRPASDAAAILAAAVGLVAGLAWARGYGRRHASDPRFQPTVIGPAGDDCGS